MYDIVKKKIERMQWKEGAFYEIKKIYKENRNRNVIIFLYDKKQFIALISYHDFLKIDNEGQLNFYIKESGNNHVFNCIDRIQIQEIFDKFPLLSCICLGERGDEGLFACRFIDIDDKCNFIAEILKKKGVHVFRLNIPSLEDIEKDKRCDMQCSSIYTEYARLVKSGDLKVPWYISKISDVEPKDIGPSGSFFNMRMIAGNDESGRKIYLVGPCIVGGWENPGTESLAEIFCEKLRNAGYDYKAECVQFTDIVSTKMNEILERSIRCNDIVILIEHSLTKFELDATDIYNSYQGEKWLYQNHPIHSTVTANKLLADAIIEKIVKPIYEISDSSEDDKIIYYGEPQFTYEFEREISEYIDNVKNIRFLPENAVIGAIVMNCNPFTYGHRYLVEYASERVDYLYIFVVEEDLSVFSFIDRLFMVYEGIKDIPNVILVPSGHFIISKDTFNNYFEKETDIHNVSTEEDVYIFARYIAKGLYITKRFVGEEPTDYVTNIYNQTMKKVFPKYGLELIEIPRKELGGGAIISATAVRESLLYENWDNIAKLVPLTTLEYLKKIKDTVINKMQMPKQINFVQEQIQAFVQKVCSLEKVVLYTIGHDTKSLISLLPQERVDKLIYCDKSASKQNIYFNDKQVIPPEQLLSLYKEYHIVVVSTKYGAEIFEEFIQMGINMERCIFNSIVFDANYD